MRSHALILTIFFALLLGIPLAGESQERPIIIKDILVQGSRRVQEAVILGKVKTKVGDPFIPSKARDDVRAIFGLGFFDDVQLSVEDFEGGIRIIFVVLERPMLQAVRYQGNEKVKTKDLEEKAELRPGSLYNPMEVQAAADRIRTYYESEGYFQAGVAPVTDKTAEGDILLTFKINEGKKIKIDKIEIIGNKNIPASDLKKAMNTKERQYFFFRGTAQRRQFEEDLDRIINAYQDRGYVQARIETSEMILDEDRGRVLLRITVVEGPQFNFGTIDVKGYKVLPETEVRRVIKSKPGAVYSRGRLREDMLAIFDLYSNIGRAAVNVFPSTTTNPETYIVNVLFEIQEGPEVIVERINITGNTKSSEKVLRRELRVAEGELFTKQKVIRSRERLFNLGFFDDVNISTQPGSSEDKIVINIDVKERPTGIFSIGVGYSSVDQIVGTFDISQRNLFGRGQELFFRLIYGGKTQRGNIGFTEPWLFDTPLSAGFDLFDDRRIFNDFSRDALGGDIRLSYPLTEFTRGFFTYLLERVQVFDIGENASQALKDQEGRTITSSTIWSVVRDTRDNIFEPTRGSRNSLSLQVAGLGGDNRFVKITGETGWDFPINFPEGFPILGKTVLELHAEAGYAKGFGGKEVPIFERFFLGGPNSIRGLKSRNVGPKDETGAVIGGTSEVLYNVEYLIQVVPRVRLALFFDAGNAYGFGTDFNPTDLRYAAGVGFRWYSPLGPIRVDWGYNLDRKPGEKATQINFSIGGIF